MKQIPILFLAALIACLTSAQAKKISFCIDTAYKPEKPLPFSGYRLLPSRYDDAGTAYYFMEKAKSPNGTSYRQYTTPISLGTQLRALLGNQPADPTGKGMLTVVLNDFNFYLGDPHLFYINADFFIGEPNSLRHVGSVDTLYQRLPNLFKKNNLDRFLSESFIASIAEQGTGMPASAYAQLTDSDAVHYYHNALAAMPLYRRADSGVCIYKSLKDFAALKAADSNLIFTHIPSMEGDGANNFYRKNEKSKQGERFYPDEYFAGRNGADYYLSYGGSFHKLIKAGGELYFEITAKMLASRSGKSAGLGLLGTLVIDYIDEQNRQGSEGPRERKAIIAKFSPLKNRFIPCGGSRLSLMRTAYREAKDNEDND